MNYTDIKQEARRLVKASSVSFPDDELTLSANRALERAVSLIRQSEGRWQWDDSNNTDFPIATTGLVADQQDYGLDATHYRIERVEVTDENGAQVKLTSFDEADITGTALDDFLSGTGVPQYYDKTGSSIFLYPTPSYTLAAGLKIYYERGPSYFTTGDTTKSPGFNPLYHRLIPLWSAYDYASINGLDNANRLRGEIREMEDSMTAAYLLRDKDEHIGLRTRRHVFR